MNILHGALNDETMSWLAYNTELRVLFTLILVLVHFIYIKIRAVLVRFPSIQKVAQIMSPSARISVISSLFSGAHS